MRIATITAISLLAAIFMALGSVAGGGGSHALGDTSSAAAPVPTAAYVSELGATSVRAPRQAIDLPASGTSGAVTGIAWPKVAGIALVIAGALMIHGAVSLRRTPAS